MRAPSVRRWVTPACALLALAAQPPQEAAAESARPNVLLLMADDLGWLDLGCQGHPELRTPHLDAMAANGLRFERFYAAAPVCSPTRGSFLTGRHPFRYGVFEANSGHLPPEEVTLAEILREAGYATGHFGKWHLGTLTREGRDSNRGGERNLQHYAPPWEHGFETCFSTEAKVPTWDPMVNPESGEPYGTGYWREDGERETENLDGDDSRMIVDRVIPFLRQAVQEGRPFAAVVWFHTPHLPIRAGPDERALYPDVADETTRHYYGAVTAMDREVGRIRAELRRLGVAGDTLLFFCSDNGPEGQAGAAPGSAGPLRGRKRSLYEGGVRVPGIVEWPARVAPGTRTCVPAVTSDLLPTVCAAVGLPLPAGRDLDGISLLPWLEGSDAPRERPIGFAHGRRISWVGDRFKLVGRVTEQRGTEVEGWELYDLLADPSESADLLADQTERAAGMIEACRAWRLGLQPAQGR